MIATSENKQSSSRKGYKRLTDEQRRYAIQQYLNNVKIEDIAKTLKVNIRRIQDIVRNYKHGVCNTFTQDQENLLIELYKQGKRSVKDLRPYFTNIDGYAIRNKVKMFVRWGVLNPTVNYTTPAIESSPDVINEAEIPGYTYDGKIIEINEEDFNFDTYEFDYENVNDVKLYCF